MRWWQSVLDITFLVIGAFGLVVWALYFLVIGIIPLLEFLHEPRLVLGIWLALMPVIWLLALSLLNTYSRRILLIWLCLVAIFHIAFWMMDDVWRAIQIDGCLDGGERWDYEKNICESGPT